MVTKRAPLVKKLRQYIAEMPPENFAPWKQPNNKMQKIIRSQIRGKLEAGIQMVQENLVAQHFTKESRGGGAQ